MCLGTNDQQTAVLPIERREWLRNRRATLREQLFQVETELGQADGIEWPATPAEVIGG